MEPEANRLDLVFVDVQKILLRRLLRIVGDTAIAEELTQEAYLRTRRATEVSSVRNVEALLWTTARNLAFDHIRKEKIRLREGMADRDSLAMEAIADERASIEERLIHKDQIRLVRAALEKLPPRAQKAWYLSRMDGKPYPDIAAQLGVSPNTVFNDIKMVMAVLYDVRKKLEE